MSRPEILDTWDFPDTTMEPDGYDMKSVPELSKDNFLLLIERHNELVEFVSSMADGSEEKK